ncbi:DNA primase [Qipengyuania atrilutea]|uniref:DNA primase n=1 Tax=Qipengyuania atrilutea TaxID=2744473 RepID=A0A850GZB3_9SPHN|nr:DNA primase [Actirhodobacter atriluteus]NVD43737.1 DNA primase [Actirhodobacter atriluteus]
MALTPQWLDELRSRVTLSSVVMRTTKLQRAGREWKACCPFHDEKTPSFYVNDDKGFYHCFGCEAHGDVIRWMTDQRGLAFMDAVKELASEAGMEVPAADPRSVERAEKRASLHDVMEAAQDWFAHNLQSADGAHARSYLANRGVSDRIAREFGFGYAPSDRQALKKALSRFEEGMLIEAGLRIAVDDKEPYDRFRGRLMLPIHDMRGRIIAFGGRILEEGTKAPKYLNSPDTPLFDKGRTLYNLQRAAPAARQTDRMLVVEGYMDAVALAAHGIGEVVAPLGTALTETQIELLWRQTDCPILCFDGDNAGQRAAMRAIGRVLPMLKPAHSLAIVRLPPGQDPDDLLKAKGREAMERIIAERTPLLEALWQFEREATPLDTPEAKAGLKARLLEHTDTIEHPDIRSLYRRELLERYGAFAFPPRERKAWSKPSGGKGKPFVPSLPTLSENARQRLTRGTSGGMRGELLDAVMHGLARYPRTILAREEELTRLADYAPAYARVIDLLIEAAETLEPGEFSPISLTKDIPAPPDKTRFTFLREGTDPDSAAEDLAEAVSLLVERPALEAALAAATERFETDPEGAFAEQQRLLKRKLEFESRLGQIASKRAARAASIDSDNSPKQALAGEHKTDRT